MAKKGRTSAQEPTPLLAALAADYDQLLPGISQLLDQARRAAARTVNRFLTASYGHIGRYIVEFEQQGKARVEYGQALLKRLAQDLTATHGRGFSERNLRQMRAFYLGWEIRQTPSAKFQAHTKSPAQAAPSSCLPHNRRVICAPPPPPGEQNAWTRTPNRSA